jgi:predicted CXXCH cytochrome family protein
VSPWIERSRARADVALALLAVSLLGGCSRIPEATYAGVEACASCHAREAALWRGSHHDLAMQPAGPESVLGRFDGAVFEKDGVRSRFSRRAGGYFVDTDGPDGALREYRIAFSFGFEPLQQYLIELPGGRLQALGIAWDTRPAEVGGQRWFHLYPDERIDPTDELHWTGPMQNWNAMCADCHSTDLQRNYDARQDRFETTWSDVDVACEACHGPGSRHVNWAEDRQRGGSSGDPLRGLAFALGDRSGGSWAFPPGAAIAVRTRPLASRAELETCGRCHARRAALWPDARPGEPLAQAFRVALLDPSLYHADGQILGEVYEYGSFLQSRMYAAGVTCSDCHEPHGARPRAQGNALCAQCHAPSRFDSPAHHSHSPSSEGGLCVSCHMPGRTYMGVDVRRDHSFRVPRPDLSARLGVPSACSECHPGRPTGWSNAGLARREWHYAEAIHAGRSGRADAESQLLRAIDDTGLPAIVRATALSLLPPHRGPRSAGALARAVRDPDPLVRRAVAGALASAQPAERVALGLELLGDPMRSVRLEALASLLDLERPVFSAGQLARIDRVIAEYREVQAFSADRAEAQANLGLLETRLGNAAAARAALEAAIRRQPSFVPAYLGLADLERRLGRETDAEAVLRRALSAAPRSAAARHELGLALVRQARSDEALLELRRAAELEPDATQYAWVYAVALHDTGHRDRAIEVLSRAHQRRPAAREVLRALADYEAEAGNHAAASEWLGRLRALDGPAP